MSLRTYTYKTSLAIKSWMKTYAPVVLGRDVAYKPLTDQERIVISVLEN